MIQKYFKYFSTIVFLLAAHNSFSKTGFDPFNSFRWNRKNALRDSKKIDKKPWFEWWYYKVIDPKTDKAFFFSYGVVNPWDRDGNMAGTQAYLSAGDFSKGFLIDRKYSLDSFFADYKSIFVQVGNNSASDKKFSGILSQSPSESGNNSISWDINIEHKWTFNAEGWGTGTGVTNIEWYPAQASATCSGKILSNGELTILKNAPCYQDRNWGRSFPKWWSWIVSNQFEGHPETTLAVGGGRPKLLNRLDPIEGVSVGLKHKGKEYAFRPNDLDNVDVEIRFGKWEVSASNGRNKIEVSAYAPPEKFMDLEFTTPEGIVFHDWEALTGEVTVKIYEKRGILRPRYQLIDTIYSKYAGIEYGSHDSGALLKLFEQSRRLYASPGSSVEQEFK